MGIAVWLETMQSQVQIPRNFNVTSSTITIYGNNLKTLYPQSESLGKVVQEPQRSTKIAISPLLRRVAEVQQLLSSFLCFIRLKTVEFQSILFRKCCTTQEIGQSATKLGCCVQITSALRAKHLPWSHFIVVFEQGIKGERLFSITDLCIALI